jgi:Holliday junction resolvase RusA-like endonuclease
VTITIPYPPTTNNLYMTVRGKRVKTQAARAYAVLVQAICTARAVEPMEGPVSLMVTVYRPRKAGDLDNTLKAIQDSLKGFAFRDDRQIVEIHAYRRDDKANPRAVVTIIPVTRGMID